jgi:hypothetical protein
VLWKGYKSATLSENHQAHYSFFALRLCRLSLMFTDSFFFHLLYVISFPNLKKHTISRKDYFAD